MISVTSEAIEKLNEYLTENQLSSSIRIALLNGGCSGMALGLALDECKDNDRTFAEGGLTFLVEESLLVQAGKIKVEYLDKGQNSGFALTSEKAVGGGGCSSCGTEGCS